MEKYTCNAACGRFITLAGLALAIVLGGCASAPKAPSLSYGLSGYEIFPGNSSGSSVTTAIFSGWTNTDKSESPWHAAPNEGGTWAVSIDYVGGPGIGSSVSVTGGKWSLAVGDSVIFGKITGGTITWPSSLDSELSEHACGKGVGYVAVSLNTKDGRKGKMTGCLDDTHVFLGAFPPKVWGTLVLF